RVMSRPASNTTAALAVVVPKPLAPTPVSVVLLLFVVELCEAVCWLHSAALYEMLVVSHTELLVVLFVVLLLVVLLVEPSAARIAFCDVSTSSLIGPATPLSALGTASRAFCWTLALSK